jgi:tetratricopeptide (TPR) repeat protein
VRTRHSASCVLDLRFFAFIFPLALSVLACDSETIRQQGEEIRKQQAEISQQQQEIEDLRLAKLKLEQRRQDCNRAFRDFEKAQKAEEPEGAIAIYREGLRLCPDDEVAHYELGKLLLATGQPKQAAEEFEEALRINPDFASARRELEALQGTR